MRDHGQNLDAEANFDILRTYHMVLKCIAYQRQADAAYQAEYQSQRENFGRDRLHGLFRN